MRRIKADIDHFACQNLIIYWTFRLIFYNLDWWNSIIVESYRLDNVRYLIEILLKIISLLKNWKKERCDLFLIQILSLRMDSRF